MINQVFDHHSGSYTEKQFTPLSQVDSQKDEETSHILENVFQIIQAYLQKSRND